MGGEVLEWFFADGWMDNDYKYHFLFASKVEPDEVERIVGREKKDWPIVFCVITNPEGETEEIYKASPPEEFKPEPFGVTIGDNFLKGTLTPEGMPAGYEVRIDLGDLGVDLTAKVVCTGVRFVEDEHGCMIYEPTMNMGVAWWPLVPRASVEGTITFRGKKLKVSGPGYLERQLGNRQGWNMREWVAHWFYGHFWDDNDYTAVWNYIALSEALQFRPFSPLALWKGNDLILCTHNLSMSPDKFTIEDSSKMLVPEIVTMHATEGNTEMFAQVPYHGLYKMVGLPVFRAHSDMDIELSRLDRIEQIKGKCMLEHGQMDQWFPPFGK